MTTTVTTTTVTTVTTTTSAPSDVVARLVFILDRSGSMQPVESDAIGGFNSFVESQKKLEGEATMTLVLFDDVITTVHDRLKLSEVPVLTDEVFVPRGMTALFDAVGRTIADIKTTKQPNEKVIIAILTDGHENASKEYQGQQVADLIKEVEDVLGWEVLFLGANIDVTKVAQQLNIKGGKFATFAASSAGMDGATKAVDAAFTNYRNAAYGAAPAVDFDLQDAYTSNLKD